ncbi:hypothetical protein [Mesorhizobium sp. M0622]|uniref:hypothetical protein n=1 Tax=Mesorhizobium sp. M0622 TaxID=2956975 RepID=UPI00333A758D
MRKSLVGLRPRALEALDATLRRIEQGEIDGIQAFDEYCSKNSPRARAGASRLP